MCCVRDRKSLDGSSNAFCSDTVSLCEQLCIPSCQASINNIIANMLLALHNLLKLCVDVFMYVYMFIF